MAELETVMAVLAALPLLAALTYTRWLRNRRHDGEPPRTIYQVAYLAGGPDRVSDTAVAGAVERRVARLDSSGVLRRTSARSADPFLLAVADSLPKVRAARVRESLRGSEPMRSLRTELLDGGLVVPEGRLRRVWRAAVVAHLGLVVLGAAVLIRTVVITERSVALAGIALAVTTTACAVTVRLERVHRAVWTTKAGERALSRAGGDPQLVTGAMGAVALGGIDAYPDRRLARLLTLTTPSSRRKAQVDVCNGASPDGLTAVADGSPG
ncbi:TIGR04222 domain-containing membrane protein [Amycolatopsis sp. lyj-84]|uniref:TIGR04222 domain-containing membrane protein n=1 Tax=Amycolatopsis sp. lyj-84 TaxID=2789284 RepID=UPI00397CE99C